MKSLSSSYACRKRPDTLTWARACVRNPARYGTDERVRQIVADLLGQVTR